MSKSVKLSVGVNFINILRAHFSYESASHSFSLATFWQKHSFAIFGTKISYEKHARKTLMKLTVGRFKRHQVFF